MMRIIFEIPSELQESTLALIEEYDLSYNCQVDTHAQNAEIEITYGKNQSYIISLIEQKINEFAELRLQTAS